jgi:hypothetical protein
MKRDEVKMQFVSNPFSASLNVLFKPNGVFSVLSEKQNWSWIPFLLVIVSAILPIYLYFSMIDFDWYIDLMTNNSPPEVKAMMQSTNANQFRITSSFAVFVGALISTVVFAIYLNLATKIDPDNVNGFTDWFGFSWWVSMPAVVSNIISLALIVTVSDTQMTENVLYPLSLAFIFNIGVDSEWLSLLRSIGLSTLWSIYLMAVGISRWINTSTKKAFMIAIIPFVVIWVIWSTMILL